MTVFADLLSIKELRENRAEMDVRKQRDVLAEAVAKRDAAERCLAEFRQYALEHERALYEDLCRRIVRLRDLEQTQLEVLDLRNRERNHEEGLEQAELTRDNEQQHLEEAKVVHLQATKMKQKFVELVRVSSDEAAKEFEQKEDAEMEEVAELRREREEWDSTCEEAI